MFQLRPASPGGSNRVVTVRPIHVALGTMMNASVASCLALSARDGRISLVIASVALWVAFTAASAWFTLEDWRDERRRRHWEALPGPTGLGLAHPSLPRSAVLVALPDELVLACGHSIVRSVPPERRREFADLESVRCWECDRERFGSDFVDADYEV